MKDEKLINDVKAQIKNDARKDPFDKMSLNNLPNSIGIVVNNTEVDPSLIK